MSLRKLITMREALESPGYFGGLLGGESWAAWRVLLIAIVGEELTDEERAIFESPHRPRAASRWSRSRSSGASSAVAAVKLAPWPSWRLIWRPASTIATCLAPGERGVIPLLAASINKQARSLRFHRRHLRRRAEPQGSCRRRNVRHDLSLSTAIDIQVRPASFRTVRGITAVAAIGDEIAFWRSDDSANPDKEILKALRPSLATTGGPLICISSPHAKRGELYATFKRHFGAAGDPLDPGR